MTAGDLIRLVLNERAWSQQDLAYVMGRPYQALSEIMNGKKRITAQTAIQLEAALDVSARVWMTMQSEVDLARARANR
jgi:HTH-type transcriptional regulator/antitoxin HigA